MKKTIVAIILLVACCASAFAYNASNNGWWLGPTVSYATQGVEATYDFGKFDVEGSFGVPVVLAASALIQDPSSIGSLWQMLLIDQLTVAGYYSVIDRNVFTFNVGLQGTVLNIASEYGGDVERELPAGWGGTVFLMLTPSIEMKFQIQNKVAIKARLTSPAFTNLSNGSGFPLGIGTAFPYGNNNAALGGLFVGILYFAYNFVSVGCEFKL